MFVEVIVVIFIILPLSLILCKKSKRTKESLERPANKITDKNGQLNSTDRRPTSSKKESDNIEDIKLIESADLRRSFERLGKEPFIDSLENNKGKHKQPKYGSKDHPQPESDPKNTVRNSGKKGAKAKIPSHTTNSTFTTTQNSSIESMELPTSGGAFTGKAKQSKAPTESAESHGDKTDTRTSSLVAKVLAPLRARKNIPLQKRTPDAPLKRRSHNNRKDVKHNTGCHNLHRRAFVSMRQRSPVSKAAIEKARLSARKQTSEQLARASEPISTEEPSSFHKTGARSAEDVIVSVPDDLDFSAIRRKRENSLTRQRKLLNTAKLRAPPPKPVVRKIALKAPLAAPPKKAPPPSEKHPPHLSRNRTPLIITTSSASTAMTNPKNVVNDDMSSSSGLDSVKSDLRRQNMLRQWGNRSTQHHGEGCDRRASVLATDFPGRLFGRPTATSCENGKNIKPIGAADNITGTSESED